MKRYCRLLAIMLGGVLLMTSLSACGQKETIPANRTREQYELEKEFQPLFDFLEEEKKDLSKVAVYGSSISLSKQTSTTIDDYHVSLSGGKKPTGSYYVTINDKKEEYLVDFMDNELHYHDSPPREYDMDIFNLCLKPDFFKELSIVDYMANHPETYMKSISYNVSSEEFLADIRKKYHLKDGKVTISLVIESYGTYSLKIYMENQEYSADITSRIIIEEYAK